VKPPINYSSLGCEFQMSIEFNSRQQVWIVDVPQPLHHASEVRTFTDMSEGFSARILLLQQSDGTSELFLPLVEYFRTFWFKCRSWQDTTVRAVGLFYDYCVALSLREQCSEDVFRGFVIALLGGTIDSSGADRTGLLWPSTPRERVKELVRSLEDFAAWWSRKTSSPSAIAPIEIPLRVGTAEHFTRMLTWSRTRNVSMFKHANEAPTFIKKRNVDLGREPRGFEVRPAKFFPPEHVERLLWEGHARPRGEGNQNIFFRYNVRDMMIALLDGWGGLRRSDGLHLWINDVTDDPTRPGHALVVLNHPSDAKVRWYDAVLRRERETTRKEYLLQVYGLKPRNEVSRGSYHVGWKGMALDERYQSQVFWIDPAAAALFQTLYLGYIRFIRSDIMQRRAAMRGRDHPFLFVSEEVNAKTGLPGEPYSERSYSRNHQAAVERIGLPHEKNYGTTTHGLRHLFGKTLEKLKVPSQVIRKCLHHRNILSQTVYTTPDLAEVDACLREARQRIRDGEKAFAPLGQNTASVLLRLRQSLSGAEQL
jgi:integrase